MESNEIAEGAKIIIARSGDVIPKHLKTVKVVNDVQLPSVCPECSAPVAWDINKVDLICDNDFCKGSLLAKCVYFFSILDFKEFREPTIKKLFDAGYEYPQDMIACTLEELQKIEGLGNVAAKVLSNQFEELKKKGTNFAKLLTAYNLFCGVIAEKNCQKILNGLKLYTKGSVEWYARRSQDNEQICLEEICSIEGIGVAAAKAFLRAIDTWVTFPVGFEEIPITYYGLEEKSFDGQMTIVFTGFRNSEWEKQLTEQGHKIGSSISKKTTCLVVKEKGLGTTKEAKAESLGIPIFTMSEFKDKFLS